jgi:predicted dehydrogenase
LGSSQARIGIIGAGFWATLFYLPFFRDNPEARCIGVVRKTRDGLDALQREFDLEVATTDVGELLEHGCDGVVVASPHSLHCAHAIQALDAGAHVLVEKPMTVSLSDALRLRDVANRSDRSVSIAYGWSYTRMGVWAIETANSGVLGRVTSLTGYMASALVSLFSGVVGYGALTVGGYEFRPEAGTWDSPGAGGGGYLYGQLSHQLGLALAMHPARPAEVFCRTVRLPNDVDLDVQVSIAFADGSVGSFSGHGRLPISVRYPHDFRVVGTNGILYLDFDRERAEVFRSEPEDEERYILEAGEQAFTGRSADLALDVRPGEGAYACDSAAQFLVDRCLGRDVPNRAPVDLGVRTVAVMEAAERSSRLGEPVSVGDLTLS